MSRLVLTQLRSSTQPGSSAPKGDGTNAAAIALRLTVAREIASSMPTLTAPGQQFAMRKIVALFNADVRQHVVASFGRDSAVARNAVEQLCQETTRIVPDVEMFSRTVESLMAKV